MWNLFKRFKQTGALRGFVYNSTSFSDVIDAAIDGIFKKNLDVRNALVDMTSDFTLHKELRQALYE